MASDLRQCKMKGCMKWKPESAFLKLPRGWHVDYCNECASKNMARWASTHHVGKKVEEYKDLER
jgi:hypothetical protein